MQKTKTFIFILFLLLTGCSKTEVVNRAEPVNQPAADENALKLIKLKDSVAPFFKPMGKPEEYDWLARFSEAGQTFEEYLGGNPTLPTNERQTIYIQPMGKFTPTELKVLQLTAEYMKDFYKLPVKMNDVQPLEEIPAEMQRVLPKSKQKQIKTGYFLENLLPKILPPDAAAFICFTNYDLYPDENWYFVFGQATFENRVGVWSLSRLGEPDKSAEDYKNFLARTLKIAMHETGHMFSMHHCTKYECLMSGTNHLGETDRRPLDVCPECMAKIAWAFKYEPAERYRKLAEFWRRQGWTEEEKSFIAKAEAIEKASK
jgi:archaemetzincin